MTSCIEITVITVLAFLYLLSRLQKIRRVSITRYHRVMAEINRDIGANLAKMRGRTTQDQLARMMQQRGYSWTKMTVYNIERGERPIRLNEAVDVLKCLNVDAGDGLKALIRNEVDATITDTINSLQTAVSDARGICISIRQLRNSLKSWFGENAEEYYRDKNMSPPSDDVREEAMQVLENTKIERVAEDLYRALKYTNRLSRQEVDDFLARMAKDDETSFNEAVGDELERDLEHLISLLYRVLDQKHLRR